MIGFRNYLEIKDIKYYAHHFTINNNTMHTLCIPPLFVENQIRFYFCSILFN